MSELPINDLNDYVLRHLFQFLSLRERINVKAVCKRWYNIIDELLLTQTVITALCNDNSGIPFSMRHSYCCESKDWPVNVSIGRLLFKGFPFNTVFVFTVRNELCNLLMKCPNIVSIHMDSVVVRTSDVKLILKLCPFIKCLSFHTDEFNGNEITDSFGKLKHLSINSNYLANPIVLPLMNSIEEIMIDASINFDSVNALSLMKKNIRKFHLSSSNILDEDLLFEDPLLLQHNNGINGISILSALCGESRDDTAIRDLKINVSVNHEMISFFNHYFPTVETLHLRFDLSNNMVVNSLRKMYSLKNLFLDFNSTIDTSYIADDQLIAVLRNVPNSIRHLHISAAVLKEESLKVMVETVPQLQHLQLKNVIYDNKSTSFWQFLPLLAKLEFLGLDYVNFGENCTDGIEHLSNCQSLNCIELIKIKKWINIDKFIEICKMLVERRPLQWFTLYIDKNELIIDENVRKEYSIPQNFKLLNIGWKINSNR